MMMVVVVMMIVMINLTTFEVGSIGYIVQLSFICDKCHRDASHFQVSREEIKVACAILLTNPEVATGISQNLFFLPRDLHTPEASLSFSGSVDCNTVINYFIANIHI